MGEVVAFPAARPEHAGERAVEALDAWLTEYAGVSGRSPVSVDSQRRHVRDTLERIARARGVEAGELLLADVDREAVTQALLDYRMAPDRRFTVRHDRAPTWKSDESVRRRSSALRSFFGWCVRTGRLLRDPTATIESPKAKPPLPKAFSEDEARAILTAALDGPWPERDVVALTVALGCGPRLAELAGMTVADIDGTPPTAITVLGKGRKERRLALNPLAATSLATYLDSRADRLRRHAVAEQALWVATRPRRLPGNGDRPQWTMALSRHGLVEIVDRCLAVAGVRRPGQRVHALRHTFATLALSSKAYSLRELQEALGHASLATTGRYVKVTDDDLIRAAAAHPLAR